MAEEKDTKIGGEIVIYKDDKGPELRVTVEDETVWLSQAEMAELFNKDVKTISTHIRHIYEEKELERDKTSLKKANSRITSIGLNKLVFYYNLDVIISVGYRVKSNRGTQFRIWATQKLRDYILKGFTINQLRLKEEGLAKLKELEQAVTLLQGAIESKRLEGYEKELLNIITDYTKTWVLLNKYDEQKLEVEGVTKQVVCSLHYDKIKKSIEQFKARLIKTKQAGGLFGQEVQYKLQAILGNIEQTFDGRPVYPSIEEKAAHLLYFAIKDHPFADGNKRIGSLLFLLYLIENRHNYNKKGERIISDNTLTALALLIAESKPGQKDVMVKLVVNMLTKK